MGETAGVITGDPPGRTGSAVPSTDPAVPAAPSTPSSSDPRTTAPATAGRGGGRGGRPGGGRGADGPARPGTLPSAALRIGAAVLRSTAVIALLAVLWEVLPRTGAVDRTFLPPLSEVAVAWYDLLIGGELAGHVQASLIRALSGFLLAIVISIPLGLLIGRYGRLAVLVQPALELFRNTAALALLPVFVLILGLGETSKIAIVLYAGAWPILLNTISAVKEVDPLLIKSARSMGIRPLRLFQKVILPAAVPTIFTGVRLAGTYSIIVLVAAEMVGAKEGLGFLINDAQFNFRIPDMYAGIITISLIGLAFNQLLIRLERRFSTWRTTS